VWVRTDLYAVMNETFIDRFLNWRISNMQEVAYIKQANVRQGHSYFICNMSLCVVRSEVLKAESMKMTASGMLIRADW
jgi:hypothetical protein